MAHRLGVEPGHQGDRLIGELQPLDIREAVAAVAIDTLSVTVTMSSLKSSGVPPSFVMMV